MVEGRRLTVSDAIILAVVSEVFGGRQEVLLDGGDGAVGVVVKPLPGCSALLQLALLPPLQTDQELVDLVDDVLLLGGASVS